MTGIELAVGYACAWIVRKARRVAGQADAEFDRVTDASMERLHDVISRKLGEEAPVLQRVREQADKGELAPAVRLELESALRGAADEDPAFGEQLDKATAGLPALPPAPTPHFSVSGPQITGDRPVIKGQTVVIATNVTMSTPSAPGSQTA